MKNAIVEMIRFQIEGSENIIGFSLEFESQVWGEYREN
jgi:hypothetical protein